MVTILDSTAQLLQQKPIQLGTTDEPCTVLFGRNEKGAEKPWRSIQIVPNDADLATLKAFDNEHDDLHDLVKERDDIEYVTVKVHENFTKCFNEDKSQADLKTTTSRDQRIKVVVRGRKWKMNDQQGVSLRAALIVSVADDVSIDDVM